MCSDPSTGVAELGKDQMDIKKKMSVPLGDDLSLRLTFEGFSDNEIRKGRETTKGTRSSRASNTDDGRDRSPSRRGTSSNRKGGSRGSSRQGSSAADDGRTGVEMALTTYENVPTDDNEMGSAQL